MTYVVAKRSGIYQSVRNRLGADRVAFVERHLKEAHVLFVIIALLGGLFTIHIIPPLWGNDEATHVARVYQLSTGHVLATKTLDGVYGGVVPDNVMQLILYVSHETGSVPNIFQPAAPLFGRHDVANRAAYGSYISQPLSSKTVAFSFPATASYSPIAYIGSLPGFELGKLAHLSLGKVLLLSRITTLLAYCILVFVGLFLLRNSSLKWFVFLVALLPTSIVQASIISGDAIIMGTAILLVAAVLASRQVRRPLPDKVLLAIIAGTALALPLTKPTYFPMLFLLLLVPRRLLKTRACGIAYQAGVIGLGMILLLGWTYASRHISHTVPMIEGPRLAAQVNAHRQVSFMLHHSLSAFRAYSHSILTNNAFFTLGVIGAMGWNAFIPIWLAGFALIVLTIAFLSAEFKPTPPRMFYWICGAIALLTVIVIFTVFYITYTPVGMNTILGMQGRYFIPVLSLLAIGLRPLVPLRLVWGAVKPPVVFGVSAVFILGSALAFYYTILYG